MKLSLQIKGSQHMAMTPQLKQALRLLQLSNIQLKNEIQQALESNIMLEIAEDLAPTQPDNEDSSDYNTDEDAKIQDTDNVKELDNIPEQLPIDSTWEEIYGTSNDNYLNTRANHTNSPIDLDNLNDATETLRQHLLWQLDFTHISDKDRIIAITLIDAINENGYLNCSLDEIHTSLQDHNESAKTNDTDDQQWELELDEIEAMLHMIQSFEPAGVGARNLSECLLIQLKQCPKDTPHLALAITLIAKHSDLLLKRAFDLIIKKLKIDLETMQQTMNLIQSMNPLPGRQIKEARTEYITPDVYVRKLNGRWHVELNPELAHNLSINTRYANMISQTDNNHDYKSLKSHLQEAKWFIKNLHNRNETLLRVAKCIVTQQHAFIDHGEHAMKPMTLDNIATMLEMHESTISRATTSKYIHTPRGIFDFKYFFSTNISTSYGEDTSSVSARAMIKKLIQEETPKKPLSDAKISALLRIQGIKIARRTVAKYRETMAIPPSNERKRLA